MRKFFIKLPCRQLRFSGGHQRRGFTLIELLVVIAIIGLLASVVLVALNNARIKSRDVKRVTDMKQIQTALDLYYDQNSGVYPVPAGNPNCGGWDTSSLGIFLPTLKTSGIMSQVPVDPINSAVSTNCQGPGAGAYTYRYYRYGAGAAGCDASRGAFYVLGINIFESSPAPAQSPGWSCPLRDWAAEFQWVTGKFEK